MVMIAARVSAQAPHFSWSISDSSLSDSQLVRRYRIVVSAPRCGRGNRSSNLRTDMRNTALRTLSLMHNGLGADDDFFLPKSRSS